MQSFNIFDHFKTLKAFKFGSIYLHNEFNIVLIRFAIETTIKEAEARQISQTCQSAVNLDQPVFIILLPEANSALEADARIFFGNDPFNRNHVKATAVIVRSLSHRITYNIYSKFNNPTPLLKAFKSNEKALSWLLENGANTRKR